MEDTEVWHVVLNGRDTNITLLGSCSDDSDDDQMLRVNGGMRWWSCYAACSLTDEEEEEFALGGRRMAVSGDSGDYLIGKSDNPTIP